MSKTTLIISNFKDVVSFEELMRLALRSIFYTKIKKAKDTVRRYKSFGKVYVVHTYKRKDGVWVVDCVKTEKESGDNE